MLTSMRKTSSSLFVKLLFVLLIASFAVWGIGDVLRTGQGDGPIQVGDRRITLATIDREFRSVLDQQSQAMGMQLTPVMGIQFGMLDQTLSNLVSRALLDNLAEGMGVRIDDDTISSFIRDQMGFTTEDGSFDRARFELYMQQQGLNEQTFIDQLRLDIARQDLLQSIIGGMRVPEIEAETLRAYRGEMRVADFVRISAEAMDEPESPTDQALHSYYDAHGDDYMAPEYRSASIVMLDPDAMAQDVTVDDEQLNEQFEYRRDSLFVPEKRDIQQMILADTDQADAAAAALKEGRSFETVAADVAGQDASTLDMGAFTDSDWFVPDAKDALFNGEVGAVSDPVETPLGWRIYRLAAIEPAHEPTLDEVRDQLTQEIARRVADDMVTDMTTRFLDEIAGGQSLAQAAEVLGLDVASVGPVSADGDDQDGNAVEVPGGDPVRTAIFDEEQGVVSTQRDLPNGGVFFVEVEDVIAPALRPFEDVRDQVVAAWTEEQKLTAAQAAAQGLYDAMDGGAKLADLAEAQGLELQSADGITRDGESTGGLPSGLAADLFALDPDAPAMSQAVAGDSFFVAQLREIVPAPEDAEATKALWLQLSAQATNDAFQALTAELQNRIQPTVQTDLIRQAFMQSYGN